MRALIGSNNFVIDVRPAADEYPAPNEWVDAPADVEIGWTFDPDTQVVSPPPAMPTPSLRLINMRDFMDRLSPETQLAIFAARAVDPEVDLIISRAGADPFNLDSAETVAGIDLLISKGLLTESDKTALLA